jgi:hypothetical protein
MSIWYFFSTKTARYLREERQCFCKMPFGKVLLEFLSDSDQFHWKPVSYFGEQAWDRLTFASESLKVKEGERT